MESTLSPATTLFTVTKALKSPVFSSSSSLSRLLTQPFLARPPILSLSARTRLSTHRPLVGRAGLSASSAIASLRYLSAVFPHAHARLACISSSASSFSSPSGDGGDGSNFSGGSGGGGDDGGSEDGNAKKLGGVASADGGDASILSPDVIILDVRGMTCGGCAASVKRILESQPQVSSANVNLTTETAIIWPVSEAKVVPDWQRQLGETLAMHLTSCGFESTLRGQGVQEGDIQL